VGQEDNRGIPAALACRDEAPGYGGAIETTPNADQVDGGHPDADGGTHDLDKEQRRILGEDVRPVLERAP
jgi:hypothetical protein